MKEFLEYVVGQLVDRPDQLVLNAEVRAGNEQHFAVVLPRSEVGKVIGKQGHTIRAIRNLLGSAIARQGQKSFLEVLEKPES